LNLSPRKTLKVRTKWAAVNRPMASKGCHSIASLSDASFRTEVL
jgi:hypothetical protein